MPQLDFDDFFATRSVDYSGDEIKLSLPDQVGFLHLRDFCFGAVLHYVDNFPDFMLPLDEQHVGHPPRVFVDDDDWLEMCQGLLEKGFYEIFRESVVHEVQRQWLLNGLFSVSKQEYVNDIEVCRLTMNLKPTNSNCRSLEGDTCTVPSATCLSSLFLEKDEMLTTSSEDIKCFFYFFQVPRPWQRVLAFGKEVPRVYWGILLVMRKATW